MSTTVHMPEVLTGVTEAAVQTWLVAPGDSVSVGTPLAEVETDKAVVEYESEVAGTVLQLLVAEGESVAIGAGIIVIGDAADLPAEPRSVAAHSEPAPPSESVVNTVASPVIGSGTPRSLPPSPSAETARRFASPLVRRLARERALDLASVVGTGPNGRIVRRDIERLASRVRESDAVTTAASVSAPEIAAALPPVHTTASPTGFQVEPTSPMRRAIARRLIESKTSVPHFYMQRDVRVDALLALRRQVNESGAIRVSVNDFVLKAVAAALVNVPEANAVWAETAIHRAEQVDIAMAVAIDGGLVTPVLRDVARSSLSHIAQQSNELAERARTGRLKQHELEGGTFSVSNLGMFGITTFSAIINPPHAGILAVGAARPMPVVTDDRLGVAHVMTVTLSGDHRVMDGAVGARWLGAFADHMENPLTILI